MNIYAAEGSTSDYVTTQENIPDKLTPVMEINPDDGVGVRLFNQVAMGEKTGIPIYTKLRDSSGNPIAIGSRVAIGYERPTDNSVSVVSNVWGNIQPYNQKSISEQQDTDNIDSVKHALDASSLEVRDIDRAYLLVDSPDVVVPANSEIYVEQSAVEEVDIE